MLKQLQSFLLPFSGVIVFPGLFILLAIGMPDITGIKIHGYSFKFPFLQVPAGIAVAALGIFLMINAISLVIREGKGTLAPWNPTQRLVVTGIYRYTRNPMISGVLFIILGEGIALGSIPVFVWFIIFFAVNMAWFIVNEEPGLVRRFGDDYAEYKKNVPRWVPRLTPWEKKNKS